MNLKLKPKIIGGMFGLPDGKILNKSTPRFIKGQSLFLANARSGIAVLIDLLSPTQIWMPSYLCASMIQATNNKNISLRFYEIDYNLVATSKDWLNDVRPGDLVVVIDYFGLACSDICIKKSKEQGAWVLEDACQALLSNEVGRFADFVLFSPLKFIGVPDGGILNFNHRLAVDKIDLKLPSRKWWLKAFFASVLRREFDNYGKNKDWFTLFQKAGEESPAGPYVMSELTSMLIKNCFDYSFIAHSRVENYKYLADRFRELAIFPSLPEEAVPLGFPIRVKNRDRVRLTLFDHQIYPPVHWPVPENVPAIFGDSYRLANNIMTLPCDQRYGVADMQRMARVVEEALKC